MKLKKEKLRLGDVNFRLFNYIDMDIYLCEHCGKLEFYQSGFQPTIEDNDNDEYFYSDFLIPPDKFDNSSIDRNLSSDTIAQITCPNCGDVHDIDYPKCPNCGHKTPEDDSDQYESEDSTE
jgi:predicted RNA-binding Zn-ribbon protein involved in translation (DUF1610 family)